MTAAIIEFQRKQQAKFMCSACGADRACDCNAPALEREAARREVKRQNVARHREKKRKQKQQSGSATGEVITVEDDIEADEYREAFLLRTADALSFAVYSGEVDREVIAAAKRVAAKWQSLIQTLEDRHGKASA
jgi:hypothetical protein